MQVGGRQLDESKVFDAEVITGILAPDVCIIYKSVKLHTLLEISFSLLYC